MGLELYIENYGFDEYSRFDLSLIRIDQEIRELCKQNTCRQYDNNHMCPPAVMDLEEWKKEIGSYKNAVLVTRIYPTKSSFDLKGMLEGAKDFQKTLIKLREDITNEYPKIRVLGAGACLVCEKCTYGDGEPCRFPEKAISSIEACGIDVMSLSKKAGVKYNNGKNTVTYLGMILY